MYGPCVERVVIGLFYLEEVAECMEEKFALEVK